MFLLYLWGIETYFHSLSFFFVELSFYFTYEELKPLLSVLSSFSITQFLLYLWGIETGYPDFFGKSDNGFYFTYEELKPINGRIFLCDIHGFYFTYEELKHTIRSQHL